MSSSLLPSLSFGFGLELVSLDFRHIFNFKILDLNQSAVSVVSSVLLISLLKSFISKMAVAGGIMTCGLAANAIITAGVATVALSLFMSLTAQ